MTWGAITGTGNTSRGLAVILEADGTSISENKRLITTRTVYLLAKWGGVRPLQPDFITDAADWPIDSEKV